MGAGNESGKQQDDTNTRFAVVRAAAANKQL